MAYEGLQMPEDDPQNERNMLLWALEDQIDRACNAKTAEVVLTESGLGIMTAGKGSLRCGPDCVCGGMPYELELREYADQSFYDIRVSQDGFGDQRVPIRTDDALSLFTAGRDNFLEMMIKQTTFSAEVTKKRAQYDLARQPYIEVTAAEIATGAARRKARLWIEFDYKYLAHNKNKKKGEQQ